MTRIYEPVYAEWMRLLPEEKKELPFRDSHWQTAQRSELVLPRETRYELGGGVKPAVQGTLFRFEEEAEDGVFLCGNDLCDIREDCAYGRLSVLNVRQTQSEEENALYRQIKDIELTKYRVYPKNCMVRLSPGSGREQIRIGNQAIADGISFADIGKCYIDAYKKNPSVTAVQVYFFTEPSLDWKVLTAVAGKTAKLTETLNTITAGFAVSCDSCSLREICDEVEGLRELHFKQGGMK